MEKRKVVEEGIILFWLFILGSMIGYIYEMIVVLFQKGYFESRQGLIYGPFTPVYGIGMILYYLVLKSMDTRNKVKIFFVTMLLGRNHWISMFLGTRKSVWYDFMGLFLSDLSYKWKNEFTTLYLLGNCWDFVCDLYSPNVRKIKTKNQSKKLSYRDIDFGDFHDF